MIDPVRFKHQATDPWTWRAATGPDVPAMVDLVQRNYARDVHGTTEFNPVELSRNFMYAIVNQMYNPKTDFVSVAVRREDDRILAVTWCVRGIRQPWSTEEMVVPRMLSSELGLSTRTRLALSIQAMYLWERWAHVCELRSINSSSMRLDWSGFMQLHDRMGYSVRGSNAFKRLSTITYEVNNQQAVPKIILP